MLLPVLPYAQKVNDSSISKPLFTSENKFLFEDTLKRNRPSFSRLDSFHQTQFKSDSLKAGKLKCNKISKLTHAPLLAFHGNATIDLYYADVQNPRQLNQNQYARLYFNPTISLFGLPFTSTVFLTSENNNFFNSNSISFKFDAQAYRRQLIEKYQKKLKEEQTNLGTRNTELFKTDKALDKQKAELEKEKQKLKISDDQATKKIVQMEKDKEAELNDSINKRIDGEKSTLQDSLGQNNTLNKIQKYKDSINHIRTEQTKRIENLNNQLEKLQQKRDSIKEQIAYYKKQVDFYKKLAQNPYTAINGVKKNAEDSLNSTSKFKPRMQDVRQLDMGLFYANQSELTTAGLPVKGLNCMIAPGRFILGAGGGKTMSSFNSLSNSKQSFDRNVAIFTLGYEFYKQSKIVLNSGYLWDEAKNGLIRKSDFYSSLTLEHQFNQFQIKAEAAYSKMQSRGGYIENTSTINNETPYINYNFSDQLAYKFKVNYDLFKHASFSGTFSKVPLTYQTLGNPYMRRDYREYEAAYKQKIFKNLVEFEIFYKENRNNLNNFETYTTRAKGYGISLQTNFTSLPNLTLSYLPYSMGNNHPDSALRTRSQFSVMNAVLSYALFRSKFMWNSLWMISQSQAELAPGQLSGNVYYSSSQTLDYKSKLSFILSYNASRFQYTSDTLNYNQGKFILTIKASRTIQPQFGGDYAVYKNGASKSSLITGLNFRIKKTFSFRFNYTFSHLYRLWGFEDRYAHQLKASLLFAW